MATPIQKTATAGEYIVLRDASDDILIMQGLTLPADTTTWFAKWCQFIDTDVVTWTSWLYVNVWTNVSCVFKLVTNAV
jgi:hypothetical protein